MKARLLQWAERIDARSLRERLLIFAMAALALVMLVTTLALDPLTAKRKVLLQRIAEQQARMAATQGQIQTLIAARTTDPDAANRSRLAELRLRIGEQEEKLAAFQRGMVSSDRMADVLREMLGRNRNVRLVSLRTLPVTTLADGAKAAAAEAGAADPRAAIYRHGVELTVEGGYADLLAYVTELEAMPWRVFWGGASLSVQTYPVSRLTLTVYTISLEQTWLSV